MHRRTWLALTSLIAFTADATMVRADHRENAAVNEIGDGYIDAWKRSDPTLLASHFVRDGDFINPTGFHAVGRAAISQFYAQAFAAGYKGSDAAFTPRQSRQVAPGVVVIDGEWRIAGAHFPDGRPRPEEGGLATAVVVRTPAGWRIAALREQSSATKITP
jgi:uncharacterized protein (TIGR02246 family)